MNTDYAILAARLQASPLYRRLGHKHMVAKMLMTKVYDVWFTRPEMDITPVATIKPTTNNGAQNAIANLSPNAAQLLRSFDSMNDRFNHVPIGELPISELDGLTELRRAGILTLSASDRPTTAIPYVCPLSGEVFHFAHKRQS